MGTPRWAILEIEHEETRTVARVRLDEPDDTPKALSPNLIVLNWNYQPGEAALPTKPEQQAMSEFEELLDELSGDNGNSTLMLVVTGLGTKQWAYYARSAELFLEGFQTAVTGRERFPIEVRRDLDPAWEYWQDFAQAATGS